MTFLSFIVFLLLRKRCSDCPRTFKLQIQLNRHKEHCTKKEEDNVLRVGNTKMEGGNVLRVGNTPKSFTLNELKVFDPLLESRDMNHETFSPCKTVGW